MSHTFNAPVLKDTYLYEGGGNNDFGVGLFLDIGMINGLRNKSLIHFDISGLPAGAVILSATLNYRVTSVLGGSAKSMGIHRALTAWFEGNKSGNGSTTISGSNWNLRNFVGSVPWGASTAGGQAGVDYATSPIATASVVGAGIYSINVTAEVTAYKNGTVTNLGWWAIPTTFVDGQYISSTSRENGTTHSLTIVYNISEVVAPSSALSRGSTQADAVNAGPTVTPVPAGALGSRVNPNVGIGGQTFLGGQANAGGSTANPTVNIAASLSPNPDNARGSTVGPSAVIKGDPFLTPPPAAAVGGTAAPASLVDLTLRPSPSTAIASTVVTVVAQRLFPQLCTPDPVLLITDGSVRPNGQLNQLSLLTSGFLLNDWKPNISQYKDGGVWSDSALSEGRTLARRAFTNALEVMDMRGNGKNQDNMYWFMQQLFAWQERAADFWVSDWGYRPIYLVSKGAKETNPRFALIKAMSIPELSNPYAQPFYSRNGKSGIDPFTLRIERGHWLSTPPGLGDCVPLSGVRSWTVQGWTAGNTTGGGDATISGAVLSFVQLANGDILAGTNDQGKIYRSSDNGATWIMVAKLGTATDAVNALTVSGVGSVFAAMTGTAAVKGIWKSTNNGNTWTRVYNDSAGLGYNDIDFSTQQSILVAGGGTSATQETQTLIASNNDGVTWKLPDSRPTSYGVKAVAFQKEPVLANSYPNQPASAFNVAGAAFVGYDTFYTIAGVVWMDATPTGLAHAYTPGSGQMGNGGLDMAVFLHKNPQGSYYRKALWAVKSAADVTDTEIWQWPNPAGGFNFGKLTTIDNKLFNVLYVDPVAWQSIGTARTIWAGANGELYVSYNNGLTWTLATTAPVNQIRSIIRTKAGTLITGGDSGEVFIYQGASGSTGGGVGSVDEQGRPINVSAPVGGSTIVNSYPLGMEESCDDAVFASNKSSFNNLTHVLHYNGTTYSELQFATKPPYSLLGATTAVNKAVYFGSKTSDTNVPGGTFSSVVFELTQIADNVTVVWEYWNGAAWATLTVQDSTNGFKTLGVGSVHWIYPTAWATTTVNGVLGFWVRARVTAVGSNPVVPIHDNIHSHRYIYTANLPYVEISDSGVMGDLPANAQIRWHNRADDPGASIDLAVDRTICGLRSVARGPYFNAYLNISDTQIPFGIDLSKDIDGIWGTILRAPTNRALTVSYASAGRLNAWNDLITFTLTNTVARDYYGSYRAFVRCYKYGTGTNNWQIRLRTTFGTGGSQSTSQVRFPGAGNDWEVLDLGQITIPSMQVSFLSNNLGDSLTLTVQGNCSTTGIGIVLYDLILIPTDEWGCDSLSPNPTSNVGNVKGGSYLDIDSITNPKALITSTNRNAADQIISRYQAITNGPAILQARQQQRLWFLVLAYEGFWRSFPEIAGSVQIFKQQKYLAGRGAS